MFDFYFHCLSLFEDIHDLAHVEPSGNQLNWVHWEKNSSKITLAFSVIVHNNDSDLVILEAVGQGIDALESIYQCLKFL